MSNPPTVPAEEPSGLGRASALLASGTFVSRILGFVSALVLAITLGTQNAGADTFALANQLPNNIYAIIAGGLLSAVLVPQIVRAGLHDDGGQRFVNKLVTLGAVVFIAVAVLATIGAPLLVSLYAGIGGGLTGKDLALATAFAYWCLPQILFYALYSLLGEVLNARKVFGPFTWAPVINNVVAIAGMIAFLVLFGGADGHPSATDWTPQMIALIGGSATLGVAAQAFVLLFFWRRTGLSFRPDFRWRGVGLGNTGKAAAWIFGMILVNQFAGLVESNVAGIADTGDPSYAVLKYAWLIFMLPHSIVTVSIGTAYFTRMSAHARDRKFAAVRADVSSSLRAILLIMVFATVGLIVLAYPFSAVFSNNFSDTQGMGNVVIAFLLGLIPFTVLFVLQRTFYALEDTRTPFFIQIVQAVIFTGGALLAAQLPSAWIAVGIAVTTTIAGSIQALITAVVLRRRIDGLGARLVLRRFVQYLVAMVPAALVGFLLLVLLGGTTDGGFAVASRATAAVSMAIIGTVMAALYFGALFLLRNPEMRAVSDPLLARLRRK